jgi:hypothetical protein
LLQALCTPADNQGGCLSNSVIGHGIGFALALEICADNIVIKQIEIHIEHIADAFFKMLVDYFFVGQPPVKPLV